MNTSGEALPSGAFRRVCVGKTPGHDGEVWVRGTRSERIVTDLSAGHYYLVVTGVEGAYDDVHAYRLNATHLGSGKP